MSDDKITMLCEQFQNHQTGETVEGITVMIEGRFKQMLDIFMHEEGAYENYTQLFKDIIFAGVNSFIEKYNQKSH